MPTFITATPNPVTVTVWSISQQGLTTISWDTGSASTSGTVWVTDDTGTRKLIGRNGVLAVGARGTAQTLIRLGTKSVFELKRTNNPQTILKVVVVEGREELGLPGSALFDLQQRGPLIQGITNLRVLPDVDWVRILFRTRQPTNPIIDIKDATTQELATGAVLGRLSHMHDYTFPLAQDTFFKFHIAAYSSGFGSSGGKPVEAEGLFRTGSRHAHVFFDQVVMHTDGDPGSLGDGEFTFDMGAGDIDSGDMLGATQFGAGISGGEFRTIDQSVAIVPAPVGLWVQVRAEEDDSFFVPFGGTPYVTFAPEGSTWKHQSTYGETETATVTKWFDLSDAGPVAQEIPFKLETGPRHIDFTLNCRLRMEVKPGAVLQPSSTKSLKPIDRAKTVAMMVSGERVVMAGRKTRVLQLARDGHLYSANPPDRGGTTPKVPDPNVHWTSLAGDLREPLVVVAAGDDLHLLSVGEAGDFLHRVLSPDVTEVKPGDETSSSLGGTFIWPPAVAVTFGNIDLFALSAEGGVFHKALGRDAEGAWTKIGEGMVGSLNAFTTQHRDISIVAVGFDGEIQYLPFSPKSVNAGSPKWQSIGTAPRGSLSAEVFDDVVVLAVVDKDETVSAAPWRNYPEQPDQLEWLALGTLNSLISVRYSLLAAIKAAAEPDSLYETADG